MDQVTRESEPAVETTWPIKATGLGPLTGANRNFKLSNQAGQDRMGGLEQHDSDRDGIGHKQWQAAGPRTDLGLSWQVKSFHQGNTLLAHVQGCRTLLGPGQGLGPVRVGRPGRTAAAAHNPRHRTRNHPRRFHSQDADPKC
jgi:hypothetical protein